MMKKWMLTFTLLMCGIMSVQAQIPAEVKDLLKKVAAKMDHPSGTEVDMNVRAKMFIVSVNMKMTVYGKGDKQRMKGTMKILGKTAQIDLVVPATTERTDYLCEMKYSEGKYAITAEYEEKLTEKLEALRNSSAHKRTHSILLVLVTTFGLTSSIHNGHVNVEVTLNELLG